MKKYRQNLMSSSACTCSGYCYQTAKSEEGRSMVEMLGTLAIIGVLSVGSIAGYTYAMNKYYTNELLAGASERAVIVASQLASGRVPSLSEFDKMKKTAGGTFDGTVEQFSDGFGIKVSGVKEAVCKNLIKTTEDTDIILTTTDGSAELTETDCSGDTNEFLITFENMPFGSSESGGVDETACSDEGKIECIDGYYYQKCEDGHWNKGACSTSQTCMNGSCVSGCSYPSQEKLTENSFRRCTTSGNWSVTTCSGSKVVGTSVSGQMGCYDCVNGEKKCVSATYYRECQNGYWSDVIASNGNCFEQFPDCPTEGLMVCNGLEGNSVCSGGKWHYYDCPAETPFCPPGGTFGCVECDSYTGGDTLKEKLSDTSYRYCSGGKWQTVTCSGGATLSGSGSSLTCSYLSCSNWGAYEQLSTTSYRYCASGSWKTTTCSGSSTVKSSGGYWYCG